MQTWQLQEAKSRLSELIRHVTNHGPQAISVRGKDEVVILSKQDYDKLTGKRIPLTQFMQQSPLKGLKLDLDRSPSKTRTVNL